MFSLLLQYRLRKTIEFLWVSPYQLQKVEYFRVVEEKLKNDVVDVYDGNEMIGAAGKKLNYLLFERAIIKI